MVESAIHRLESRLSRRGSSSSSSSSDDFGLEEVQIKGTFTSALNLLFGKRNRLHYRTPPGVDSYVISPDNRLYQWWVQFILLCATFSSFFTPLEFGFFRGLPSKMNVVEWLVQALFLMDSVLQFFVAYRDARTYKFVYDKRRIALRHVKSSFILDIMGCVPWDSVYKATGREEWVRYMIWVRLYRARKIIKFFENMEKDIRINYLFTRITKLITVELYCTHTAACIFYYLATIVPPSREGYTWIGSLTMGHYSYKHFREIGLWRKYITSLYFAIVTMATVGYGDVHAVSTSEMIFIMIYVSFDMILGAYLIGNMTALIVKGSKTERFRDKMADIIRFMSRNKIEKELRTEIKDHQRLQYETDYNEASILQDIPLSIRAKIAQRLYKDTVEKVMLFKGCSSDFINQIVTKLREEFFLPGDLILEQGQAADQFYIVSHGTLEEIVISEEGSEETVAQIDIYDTFGEVAIICNIPQPYTVRVLELSRVLRLGKEDFTNILQLYFTDGRQILKNLLDENRKICRIRQQVSEITYLITRQEAELILRLNSAAYHGDLKYVKDLIRAGADPQKGDYDGRTGLQIASSRGFKDIVQLLVKEGADVNHADNFENTPLLEAVKSGHEDIAALLMNRGATLHLQDAAHHLCKAVADGQTAILKRLLAYGLDPNWKNFDYRTPLHVAASEGLHSTARILLDYGACVFCRDRWGHTPLVDAHRCGNKMLIDMLENSKHASCELCKSHVETNGKRHQIIVLNDNITFDIDSSSSLENVSDAGNSGQPSIKAAGLEQPRVRCLIFPFHPRTKTDSGKHGLVMWVPNSMEQLLADAAAHFGYSGTCLLTEDEAQLLDTTLVQNNEKLYLV